MDESPNTLREVTLDEAMSIAKELQRSGRLDDAGGVYRKILALVPDHADALHYSGVLAHQQGRSSEAVALIERSLEIAPTHADAFNNLGIVLKALGRFDEAVEAYKRAIALDPDHAKS